MPNYNETAVAGTKWRRARQVTVDNTYQQVPKLVFFEQDVITLEDGTVIQQNLDPMINPLQVYFSPDIEIPMIDSTTGQPTGEVRTHKDLYQLLNSLYVLLATTRDVTVVPPAPQPVAPSVPVDAPDPAAVTDSGTAPPNLDPLAPTV